MPVCVPHGEWERGPRFRYFVRVLWCAIGGGGEGADAPAPTTWEGVGVRWRAKAGQRCTPDSEVEKLLEQPFGSGTGTWRRRRTYKHTHTRMCAEDSGRWKTVQKLTKGRRKRPMADNRGRRRHTNGECGVS